ncbi:hypothetical protein NHX12_024464 [Muraenolepis orangiensis]|uniref:Transcription factor AP-2 C-terminal domain-containing protein n=1 Tax=Muraenolepis orangiensis TaxID=630683 RepID=A0A9Q0EL34_9TELE|nr:hypothetical protein NHX12_024464 [Muraenolepis orangiensis]
MDPSTSVVGLDAQGNVLFRVMKPVLGPFQVSSEQANSGVAIQGLSDTSLVLTQGPGHALLAHSEGMMDAPQPQILQVQAHAATPTLDPPPQSEEPPPCQISNSNPSDVTRMPFAEVSSLLDPNMKGSKARKCLISYEEIKRRLQSPEKMSLRSLAAYTRVSRGPASKKTLLESLHILGLTPGTTTAVSSSFSKLTEDPVNSEGFDSVTHGLGLGMLDVALDMVSVAIDQQIRILSGAAASDPPDLGPAARRLRRRNRKPRAGDKPSRVPGGVKGHIKVLSKGKGRGRARGPPKAPRPADPPAMEAMETVEAREQQDQQNGVLTLVSVGYETISAAGTI